jgi:hypothetical protein
MAELCRRGDNVSIPEIDIGDDIFVLDNEKGSSWRIQVKTASGVKQKKGNRFRCQFNIDAKHVSNQAGGGTHYVLVGSCDENWLFIVIEKAVLRDRVKNQKWGSPTADRYVLSCVFENNNGNWSCKTSTDKNGEELDSFLSDWKAWPKR